MNEDKFPIPVAHNGFRIRFEIKNCINNLKEMYDVNYYEVISNKDFTNLSFTPKNEIEKIIRIIPIKDNDKFKSNKLELGIITINLSSVRSTTGTQLYINIYTNLNYYLYSCYINSLYQLIILCVTKSSPCDICVIILSFKIKKTSSFKTNLTNKL